VGVSILISGGWVENWPKQLILRVLAYLGRLGPNRFLSAVSCQFSLLRLGFVNYRGCLVAFRSSRVFRFLCFLGGALVCLLVPVVDCILQQLFVLAGPLVPLQILVVEVFSTVLESAQICRQP
jgi:hypothetical protein